MTAIHHGFPGIAATALALGLLGASILPAQEPEAKTRETSDWIREDIDAGYAEALATGKPLLVVFR